MEQNNYKDAALLVMDVQNGIVARLDDEEKPLMDNLTKSVKFARDRKCNII